MCETEILKPTDENICRAAELIKSGELVAFPTETVYGLGADGLNKNACEKIYTAKGRPSNKPLTLHVADLSQVERVAKISALAEKLFERFCPGPLTIILQKKNLSGSVGIRFPDNKIALDLIRKSDCLIAAPSANISGQTPPRTAREVFDNLRGRVKIILDGGECKFGVSSTILDISRDTPQILRVGAIPEDTIKNFIEQFFDS